MTLRAISGAILAVYFAMSAALTPDEANAACQAENDALAACTEAAERRLAADDDDAAVFCSLAVETLASQCAAPSDCPAENRARLSCYYQQLCEDPTLGCEPLATAAPAPRPTSGLSGGSPSPTVAPTAPESDDAATVRLGGVCAAAVWLLVA